MKRNRKYEIDSFEEQWMCPISNMPMVEPVMTLDGQTYEKKFIVQWLAKQQTSPKTGLALPSPFFIPNIMLKSVIQKFKRQLKHQFDKLSRQNKDLSQKNQYLAKYITEYKKVAAELLELKEKYADLLTSYQRVKEDVSHYQQKIGILRRQNKKLSINKIKLIDGKQDDDNLLEMEKDQVKLEETGQNQKRNPLFGLVKYFLDNKQNITNFFSINTNSPLETQEESTLKREEKMHNAFAQNIVSQEKVQKKFQIAQCNSQNESVRKTKRMKIDEKIQENKITIKHILPYNDYFYDCPVLYDETTGDLDHLGFKINIPYFLQHNWSSLRYLNLNNSQLDDEGVRLLLEEGAFFANLDTLSLCKRYISKANNIIQQLPEFTFERFPRIRRIFFTDRDHSSHLNSESKKFLEYYRGKNPAVEIRYEHFHP